MKPKLSFETNIQDGKLKFEDFIADNDPIKMITDKVGLEMTLEQINVVQSEKADYEVPNTIYLNFARGRRAVSSFIHEYFHLLLRDHNWEKSNILNSFVEAFPVLKLSARGVGYKLEQMIAYLLQNEVYSEMATIKGVDIAKETWGNDFFEKVLVNEFDDPDLYVIGSKIIDVWNSKDRPNNIYKFLEIVLSELI